MKIKGLKKIGIVPERVKAKNGQWIETGERVKLFIAPDGKRGTYDKFLHDAERGNLHGCIIASS